MEENVAKKFWKIVRVMYFMLKKGISKGKLLADLNIMMKRDKIAGKFAAIHKLMFHHHHAAAAESPDRHPIPENEFEFSCSNSPANKFHLPFHLKKRKQSPATDDVLMAMAFEMVNSTAASPALPGFGRTPMVRQLRVTDSPFPLKDEEESRHVDEAAEEFIMKFHRDLRQQNAMANYN